MRNFTAWFDEKLHQRIAAVRNNTPEELIGFLDALANEKIVTTMWHNYTHTPEYRGNIAGEANSKLEIKTESKGLATYITGNCLLRTRNLPSGHAIRIHTPRKDNSTHTLAYAAYDLNKQSILMAYQMGACWWSMTRAFSTLGIQYMGQGAYEKSEELVGKAIKTVAKKAMKEALEEEIELSKEAGDGTYTTEEYGELPALKMGADAGWQHKSSGLVTTVHLAACTLLECVLERSVEHAYQYTGVRCVQKLKHTKNEKSKNQTEGVKYKEIPTEN